MASCEGNAWVVTKYPDGTEIHAHPNHRPEDEALALTLAYPGVQTMTFEHDALHTMLAHALGLVHSPTLWGIAHDDHAHPDIVGAEEAAVLAIAYFHNMCRRHGVA